MTVAELIALLHKAPGHLEVVVRADDGEADYCGTVGTAQIEQVEKPVPGEPAMFFAIDCGPEESDDFGEEDEAGEDLGSGEEEDGDEAEEDGEEPN
jgi:hypothetical protein